MRPSVAFVVLLIAAPYAGGCQGLLGIQDPESSGPRGSSASDSSIDTTPAPLDDASASSAFGSAGDSSVANPVEDASAPDSGGSDDATDAAAARAEVDAEDTADATAGSVDAGQAAPLTLYGATVDLSIHCCTSPPDSTNVVATYPAAVVGPQVEFPSVPNTNVQPASIDVKASSIEIDIPVATNSQSGGFNGYVFVFSPTPPTTPEIPTILSAKPDPSSTAPTTDVVVTPSNSADGTRTLWVNVAGTVTPANVDIIIDLVLGAPDAG
jgi:hypothetical protein